MCDCPEFLELPERTAKPRSAGVTHVLDKGAPPQHLEAMLAQSGPFVDILKVGWGIAYLDGGLKERVRLCDAAGVLLCLGGTLLEIAEAQGRLVELCRWAAGVGVPALEVSNGLRGMARPRKNDLVRQLSADFVVLAEAGAKDDTSPVLLDWVEEMEADLAAGARWAVAEGRESGTVGLFRADRTVRKELVDAIAQRVPVDRVVFEAPTKQQQTWFVQAFGPHVNLGNVPLEEAVPLETLRLGLRADTARVPVRA